MMQLKELIAHLEQVAPPSYQEPYDNSGLIVGHPAQEVRQALVSLDCTEDVIDEAIRSGSDLVIAHHPIVFQGLKRFTGQTYVERVVMKAIRHGIALYAIHTNLDNIRGGVNAMIANRLGLKNTAILDPKRGLLRKLVVFVPDRQADGVRNALFASGAGHIGDYDECSYNTEGHGTFRAGEHANPFVGAQGQRHQEREVRIETVFPTHREREVVQALFEAHPYEEPAYDIYSIENTYDRVGSGMTGFLEEPMDEQHFLARIQRALQAKVVRHTALRGKKVSKVAVCGGAGGFLLNKAIAAGADFFVTADYKYHEFFDAEGKIVIADPGHFESEQFTSQLLLEIITKKFPNFAIRLAETNTNPIKYYC